MSCPILKSLPGRGEQEVLSVSRPTAPGQLSARTVAAAPPPFGGNSATPTPSAKGGGNTGGMIAGAEGGGSTGGIIAGAAGAAAVLVGGLVWLWWRCRSPRREDDRRERAGSDGKEEGGNEEAAVLGGCRPPIPKP